MKLIFFGQKIDKKLIQNTKKIDENRKKIVFFLVVKTGFIHEVWGRNDVLIM